MDKGKRITITQVDNGYIVRISRGLKRGYLNLVFPSLPAMYLWMDTFFTSETP